MSQERFEAKRKQDRRRRLLRYVLPVLGVGALGALVWVIWFSRLLAVDAVAVQGLDTLKADQVREVAEVPPGRPLARLDTVAIESRVGALERVESVEVSRSLPGTVRIAVVERTPVAWVRLDGRLRAIDRYGVDFKSYERPPRSIPEVQFPALEARQLQQSLASAGGVVAFLQENDPAFMEAVDHVEVESQDSVVLALRGDRTVTWGNGKRSQDKLRILRSLLDTVKAGGYDVSAPEQPTTSD